MNNLLENKKILVVGACGLLGKKIVTEALKQQAIIIAADINMKILEETFSKSNTYIESKQLILEHVDIIDEASVKKLFSNHVGINGAVNVTYPRNKTYGSDFLDVSLTSFNENMALHLGSAFLFMQQCAQYFKRSKTSFSLVNFSSIYGVVAPNFDIYDNTSMTMPIEYAAIKSAIIHLNKYVSAYINNSDFRINSVSPGGIFDHQDVSFLAAYKSKTNGKGMLDPDDIIGTVLFLLSEQSKFITGQNIIVDDGFSL